MQGEITTILQEGKAALEEKNKKAQQWIKRHSQEILYFVWFILVYSKIDADSDSKNILAPINMPFVGSFPEISIKSFQCE